MWLACEWSWGLNSRASPSGELAQRLDYPEEEFKEQPHPGAPGILLSSLRPAFSSLCLSCMPRPPLSSALGGVDSESESALKICQVVCVVRRKVPCALQVRLLEEKGVAPRVTPSSQADEASLLETWQLWSSSLR